MKSQLIEAAYNEIFGAKKAAPDLDAVAALLEQASAIKDIDPDNDEQRRAAFARMAEEGGGGDSGISKEHLSKLSEGGKSPVREYVNHVFGKGVNGAIGPTHDDVLRTIFAQGSKGSSFFKVGEVHIRKGKLANTDKYGKENTDAAQMVLDKYLGK